MYICAHVFTHAHTHTRIHTYATVTTEADVINLREKLEREEIGVEIM